MMDFSGLSEDTNVLLKIQNNSKPDQVVLLITDGSNGGFKTAGLKDSFGVSEIRIESEDVLGSLQEYAQVLSYLLDTMSTAQDLNLPYRYNEEFVFEGTKYSLKDAGELKLLKRIG